MLGKLIKLDLRFAYKKFLIMAGLLLVFGLVMPYLGQNLLKAGAAVIFAVVMTIVPMMCVGLVVQHFQRNLFGAEGYLMFSLPTSAAELLLSKLITTAIWFNLMLASAVGLAFLTLRAQVPFALIRAALDWASVIKLFHVVVGINMNTIPVMLAIFLGISFSTVAVRNKKLGMIWGIAAALVGIGFFFWSTVKLSGWNFLNLSVNGGQLFIGLSSLSTTVSELINLAVSLAFSALFFWITTYIMKHKLNLE